MVSQEQNRITTVLPGDDLTYINSNNSSKKAIKLGTGLLYDASSKKITATLAGRLHHRSSTNTYYILTNHKRYIPKVNDRIIAIVEERLGDYFRVSIPHSSTGSALLPTIAFEGATKRNRPNLQHGDVVYARVNVCHIKEMEPEISCVVMSSESDGGASKKDWMTDEGTYGQLKGGSLINISTGLAMELLHPSNVVLECLEKSQIPFEICIGVNGLVWVNAPRPEYTVLVLNAVQNSAVMTEEQVRGMVQSLVKTVADTLEEDDE